METEGWGRRLVALIGAGWLFGAFGLGVPLSLGHVVHSQVGSVGDALVVLAWFLVLYGGLSALAFTVVGTFRLVVRGTMQRAVALGVVVVATLFVGRYLHMALTYDELPALVPHTPGGMLLYLGVRVAAVACGAALLARLVAPALVRARMHRAPWLVTLAVIVVAHGLMPGVIRPDTPSVVSPAAPPRADPGAVSVVFIGLDGVDWRVVDPMIAAGELPALAALRRAGVSASLDTIRDANSSEIWASIYTGKRTSAHGIEDFLRIHLPGMRGPGLFAVYGTFFRNLGSSLASAGIAQRLAVDRTDLGAMPIWEMVEVAGVSGGVLNGFYYSYPAPLLTTRASFMVAYGATGDRNGKGRIVDAAGLAPYVQPPELAPAVLSALAEPEVAWQRAVLPALLARGRPRFLHVYTREPDRAQHQYWKWYQPEYFLGVREAERRRFAGRIPAMHRQVDALVGDLLPLAGPDTVLVVASDHGQSPTMLHPKLYSYHQHGPPGVLLMAGGPVRAGVQLAQADVYDLLPTMLHLLGMPVPADAAGRVLTEALVPEALAARPVRSIASYEPWQGRVRYAVGDAPGHGADEIERLRALGYVE